VIIRCFDRGRQGWLRAQLPAYLYRCRFSMRRLIAFFALCLALLFGGSPKLLAAK